VEVRDHGLELGRAGAAQLALGGQYCAGVIAAELRRRTSSLATVF
jgi:hypothetical protein